MVSGSRYSQGCGFCSAGGGGPPCGELHATGPQARIKLCCLPNLTLTSRVWHLNLKQHKCCKLTRHTGRHHRRSVDLYSSSHVWGQDTGGDFAEVLRRRFEMFDSSATQPYTVSAMACWKRAADLGYMTLDSNGKVCSTCVTWETGASTSPCGARSCCLELLYRMQCTNTRTCVLIMAREVGIDKAPPQVRGILCHRSRGRLDTECISRLLLLSCTPWSAGGH